MLQEELPTILPTNFPWHSDNARNCVNDEFKKFAASLDFKMATSSPYYSQGNGKAESALKISKGLIKKANKSKQDI
jgi:hypothetical protein